MAEAETKVCEYCGKELVRNPLDSQPHWQQRKFCDKFCSARYKADQKRNPRVCGVYEIRNLVNDKVYIGSSVDVLQRWRRHRKMLRKGTHDCAHLQASWNKYGPEAFRFAVIEIIDDPQRLIEAEQSWFEKTRCTDNRCGYNVDPTAGSRLGTKATEATKKRISAVTKGRNIGSQHHLTHLTESEVAQIKIDFAAGASGAELARRHSVSRAAIRRICRGETWTHVPGPVTSKEVRKKQVSLILKQTAQKSHSRLTENDVVRIKELLIAGVPTKQIAKDFLVDRTVISEIRNGRTWQQVGGPTPTPGIQGQVQLYRVIGSERITAKLDEGKVLDIKRRLLAGERPTAIGRIYGVAAATISLIRSGRNWAHVPWPTEESPSPAR